MNHNQRIINAVVLVVAKFIVLLIPLIIWKSDPHSGAVFLIFFLMWLILYRLFIKNRLNFITPDFYFSAMYFGYVISGVYYLVFDRYSSARYLNLAGVKETNVVFFFPFLIIIVGYICFIFGYDFSTSFRLRKRLSLNGLESVLKFKYVAAIGYFLFLLGFAYWIFISYYVGENPVTLLLKIGNAPYILWANNVRTTPYILCGYGITILLFHKLSRKNKVSIGLFLLIVLSVIPIISNGRLSLGLFPLFILYLFYSMYLNNGRVNKRLFVMGFALLLMLYFARYASSYYFIKGRLPEPGNVVEFFFNRIVGRGNVADVQQVVLAIKYRTQNGLLYGTTWFDFLNNLLARRFDWAPNSVGIRIKAQYFSQITGAPTPGIISEFLLNYGIIGVLFGMTFLGATFGVVFKFCFLCRRSALITFFYATFVYYFVFLSAKVDSTTFAAVVMNFVPVFIIVLGINAFHVFVVEGTSRTELAKN
jgi:hypothetical protein